MSLRGSMLPTPVDKAVKRLSKFLGTKRPSPNYAHSAAPSEPLITAVPIDIIEEILFHLPGRDILRVKQVNRAFADLISTSSLLKYKLELFAAGLVQNPRLSCSLEEGRRRVKEYVDLWENLDVIKKRGHPLRLLDFRWERLIPVGRDLLAGRSGDSNISFIRVPRIAAGRQEVEEWRIDPPPTQFHPNAFAVYPPEHVLALVEWRHPVFQIRLLNVKDGSPHHLPLNNVILCDTELDNEGVDVSCAKMTASRLMVFVSTHTVNVLIAWDWKTGDVVLKRSSVKDVFLCYRYLKFNFLDEFRLLTSTAPYDDELHLVMFDTSIPQRSRDSWRQLNIAPTHHHLYARNPWAWKVSIHTDSDRSQGEDSCDGPLIIDTTQSVVVIVLICRGHEDFPGGEAVLVIPTAALVGYMSSRSGQRIPWDDWKRDVMVVEIPRYIFHVRTFVHGTRVLLMTYSSMERYCVRAYDFSRWGCRALVRVGSGEKERMVMPNPEKVWFLSELGNGLQDMRALGDSLVISSNTVSPNSIYVWELI